jgi:hypothetical protein
MIKKYVRTLIIEKAVKIGSRKIYNLIKNSFNGIIM